MDSQPLYWRL